MYLKYAVIHIAVFVLVFATDPVKGSINEQPINVPSNSVDSIVKNVSKETDRAGRSLHKECGVTNLSAKCIKIHALSMLEELSSRDELSLIPGLSIVKENNTENKPSPEEMAAELSRQFPGKPEEKLNRFLLYRLQDYLDGHSLRYKLLDPQTTKEAMSMAKGDRESIGRKSGGGGLGGKGGGGLLAAAMMMKGALAAAALGALALLAGKALMAALLSMLLSALVGLKGGGGHKTTYEIIAKPEVSHHHTQSHEEHHEHDHHGHYRRAYDTGYNSYMPYDNSYSTPSRRK